MALEKERRGSGRSSICPQGHVLELPVGPSSFSKRFRERREDTVLKWIAREEGQGLVEYGLIIFLVAIVVIAILVLLGPQIATIFSNITAVI